MIIEVTTLVYKKHYLRECPHKDRYTTVSLHEWCRSCEMFVGSVIEEGQWFEDQHLPHPI